MVHPDEPVLGGEEKRPPPIWIALAATVAVLAIVLVTASEAPPAPVIPDLDRLTWTRASGPEGLVRLGGVAHFAEAWWLVGADEEGVGAWRHSGPPDRWESVSRITESPATAGDLSVMVAGARLVVVDAGVVYSSSDGRAWQQHTLPPIDASPGRPYATEVVDTPVGVAVRGWTEPDNTSELEVVMAALSADSRRLLEEGLAEVGMWRSRATVWIQPGLVVEEVSLPGVGLGPVEHRWLPALWQGPDLDTLVGTGEAAAVGEFARTPDGVVLASSGARLVLSADPVPRRPEATITEVLPYHPYPVPGVVYRSAAASGLGMVVVADKLDVTARATRRLLAASSNGTDVYLTDGDGILVDRADGWETMLVPWRTPLTVTEGDRMRLTLPDDSTVEASIRDWVDTARRLGRLGKGRVEESYLAYSPDGEAWDHVAWSQVVDEPIIRGPALFATDTFFLAFHHPQDFDDRAEVWVGTRAR